jgi:integrase
LAVGSLGEKSKATRLEAGSYQVSAYLRLPNGTRRRIFDSGRTPSDARDALDVKARRILENWDTGSFSATMTVDTLGGLWLVEIRQDAGLAVQTVQRYEASLRGRIHAELGALTIQELTNARLRRFIRSIDQSGHLSEARNSRVVLRGLLAFGVENGVGTAEVFNFDGLRLKVPLKKPRAITVPELQRLRALITAHRDRPRPGPHSTKTHDDLLDAIDLALATSLRISEVLGIATEDLDLETQPPTVTITQKVEYANGHGYRLGGVKTDATERTIPIPTFAVQILRRRAEKYGPGLVFRSSRTGGPISQNNIRNTLRTVTRGTDLTWFTPHAARKTTLTSVNNVHGPKVAAAVAGHTDERLILSTYGERQPLAPDVTDITQQFAPA